jgi:pyruvate/2-oxoglutarate dehydrogenase complex dihydrolipoamide dehydrogenase (E3) component
MVTRSDVLIIGSGQAGNPLASAFADAGKQVVLVEREHIGGTCVNTGCTPTKTMIASGRVAHVARRSGDYGVKTGDVSVDMAAVRERKRDMVETWRSGSEDRVLGTGNLRTVFGEATFTGPRELRVSLKDGGEETFSAETIVIDTGERPAPLDIPGAGDVEILDSTTAMELAEVPEHLVVVGGGYIAVELGQLFRRLGADVTIIQRGAQLLSREDEDIANAVREILEEDGIRVLLNASAKAVTKAGDEIAIEVDADGERETMHASHLLAAIGRVPNSDALDLDAAGIQTDQSGHIPTDDRLATNVPGVFAVGDIRPGPKFTHISYDDFRVLRSNLIDGENRTIEDRLVPYTVFMDPQLGRIGLTEQQARKDGRRIRVASMPMSSVARAMETSETRGMLKAVVDAETDRILGAAILGIEGGEIASMLQIALMGDLPYTSLRDGIFPHPGLAESLNTLFASFREE